MPIIGKPLLVLGSLAGVSLLGTGGYFGISHLVSLNSQQSIEPDSTTQDLPVSPSEDKFVNDVSASDGSQIEAGGQNVTGERNDAGDREEDLVQGEGSDIGKIQTEVTPPSGSTSSSSVNTPEIQALPTSEGKGSNQTLDSAEEQQSAEKGASPSVKDVASSSGTLNSSQDRSDSLSSEQLQSQLSTAGGEIAGEGEKNAQGKDSKETTTSVISEPTL